jgi:hypothetical protein
MTGLVTRAGRLNRRDGGVKHVLAIRRKRNRDEMVCVMDKKQTK